MNDLTSVPAKSRAVARADSPLGWLRNEMDRLFDEFAPPARGIFNFGAQFAPLPAQDANLADVRYLFDRVM